METSIPGYVDLMYPTLVALRDLGGKSPRDVLDHKIQVVASITDEQMAVQFPETGSQSGSKVAHRMAWSRSYLKKLGAIDNEEKGQWSLTTIGQNYLQISNGEAQLRRDHHELRVGTSADLFLKRLAEHNFDDGPYVTTVRDLLKEWGFSRRGSAVVERVAGDLEDHGLQTSPPFETLPIDAEVEVVPRPSAPKLPIVGGVEQVELVADSSSHTVTIGTITKGGLVSVAPDDPIVRAQSLMESHDFSQLAVTSGARTLKGAISWESLARSSLYGQKPSSVADAMITEIVPVPDTAPLLDNIRRIAEAGFVFVQDKRDNKLIGIVTTADLSLQFESLANPFLLIGEIERWLRHAIANKFSADDLAQYADPNDPDRQIEAVDSLTFGEYLRLCQDPDAWEMLDWPADRKVFTTHLDDVRRIRNSIMHFSADPVSDAETDRLATMLRWIRKLAQT